MTQKNLILVNSIIFFIIFVFFAIMLVMGGVFFGNNADPVVDKGYEIIGYDTKIDISEDNTYSFNEIIKVQYNTNGRHGIIRALPIHSTANFYNNENLETIRYKLNYSDVKSNLLYTSYKQDGYLCLQLGSPNVTYNAGEVATYSINYKVKIGDDRISAFDQFYYNIVGDNWDTTVSNINTTVNFPKSVAEYFDGVENVDNSGFYFYYIENGQEKAVKPVLSTDGMSVDFNYAGTLEPFTALTFRATLEKGYFNTSIVGITDIVIMIAILLVIVILILFFVRNKKKCKTIVPIVEFSEPKGLNSAECGYLIDASVDNKDLTSLIVFWGSKGYLKIVDKEDSITLEKRKDGKDMKSYELSIFNKIFEEGDTVSLESLKYKLAKTMENGKVAIQSEHDYKSFNKTSIMNMFWFVFLPFLALIGSVFFTQWKVCFDLMGYIGIGLAMVTCVLTLAAIFVKKKEFYLGKKYKIFTVLIYIFVIALLITVNVITFDFGLDPCQTKLISSISVLVGLFLIFNNIFRTDTGAKLTGQLLGLKRYIEVAEKDKIEMLAKDDPQVFFRVLPLAYVLGVSDVWCEKFKDIQVSAPDFYETSSYGVFSIDLFTLRLFTGLTLINSTLYSKPNVNLNNGDSGNFGGGSFGGGGFGGGFSGGGIGGGGGRSW